MLDFFSTVSFNHDLPFLRTSVNQDTAYDIVGRFVINEGGMVEPTRLNQEWSPYPLYRQCKRLREKPNASGQHLYKIHRCSVSHTVCGAEGWSSL